MFEVLFALIFAAYFSFNYGRQFAYEVMHYNDPVLGSMIVFVLALIAGIYLWRGPVRNTLNSIRTEYKMGGVNVRRRQSEKLIGPPEELQRLLERGTSLLYHGLVDRDFHYSDQRMRTVRLCHPFELRRHTLAMSPREREAAEVMLALDWYGLLGRDRDALRFAVVYGDGKAQVSGRPFKTDNRVLQQNNMRSLKAMVANEAEARNINQEGAISDLYSLLQAVAAADKAPQPLKDLLRRLQPGSAVQAALVVL